MTDQGTPTGEEARRFITYDPADLGMYSTVSGVRVTCVGEDNDVMIMGHHDDRTAWALYAEWQRYYEGSEVTWEDSKSYDIERQHVEFSNHSESCDLVNCCREEEVCEPCRAGTHADCTEGDDCACNGEGHEDTDPPWVCSCECACDEFAWWVNATKNGHEVTWIRWSWAKDKALREARFRSEQGSVA